MADGTEIASLNLSEDERKGIKQFLPRHRVIADKLGIQFKHKFREG